MRLHQPFYERAPLLQIINTDKNRKIIKEVSGILETLIRQLLKNSRENAFEVINQLIYTAAYVAIQKRSVKMRRAKKSNVGKQFVWM